jgi:glycine betaine/proline transport system ATP-binding protein
VSHDLDEALKLGTRIAIMEEGRVVQYAEPEDIVLKPANDYVADFVAHMNPLNVLTGATMMTPVSALARRGDAFLLDADRDLTLTTIGDGSIGKASLAGKTVPVANGPAENAETLRHGSLAVMPVAASMRLIIEARRHTGLPVLLTDDERLVGVVGDNEIYAGLLHRAAAV